MMFFDKGLLAMGNILFLSGVALTIGPAATLRFFTRRKNLRGSAAFSTGLMLVIAGWAMIGMAVEAYGFWLLFAGFFPTALAFLRRVPGLGVVLDAPIVKHALNKVAPAQLPV
jgi:Got1/Sft2-like family